LSLNPTTAIRFARLKIFAISSNGGFSIIFLNLLSIEFYQGKGETGKPSAIPVRFGTGDSSAFFEGLNENDDRFPFLPGQIGKQPVNGRNFSAIVPGVFFNMGLKRDFVLQDAKKFGKGNSAQIAKSAQKGYGYRLGAGFNPGQFRLGNIQTVGNFDRRKSLFLADFPHELANLGFRHHFTIQLPYWFVNLQLFFLYLQKNKYILF